MPTNKQRREAARRKLERQLQARLARERRRKRAITILSSAGVVVVVVLIAAFIVVANKDDKKDAGQSGAPTTTAGPCNYQAADAGQNPNLTDVGMPPDPTPTPTSTYTVVFTTNRGKITAQLTGQSAPCNVQSLAYLIGQKFYDKTDCPRVVNEGIYVVQCGDPSGTTGGGPTYTTKDENLATVTAYPAGTIAMANSGADTNGSQFFFITKDSSAGLGVNPGKYTIVGKVTAGLDILQKVAAGGNDGSSQAGGGKPKLPLTFTTVEITQTA